MNFFINLWNTFKEAALKPAPLALSFGRLGLCFVVWYDFHAHVLFSEDYLKTVTCYDPKGILNLFQINMPTLSQLNGWILVKDISLFLFAIGFITRPAGLVLLTCNLHLMGFFESINRDGYWCHGSNVLLLTQIAFLFAQPGKLSVDYFLSTRWNKYPKWLCNPMRQIAWPFYLGQASVALMFINSFYWKMLNSGPAWALSDNMRNILVLQYEMTLFQDYPAYILSILKSEVMYKSLAIFNLCLQISPVVALIFVRRPILRALLGLGFVIETLGLFYIMGLNDLEWIALYVFFIDWDYFLGKAKNSIERIELERTSKKWIRGYSFVFLFAYVICGYNFILPDFCCVYNTYPFSAFPMYSENYAKKPYGQHQGYTKDGLCFEFEGYDTANTISEEKMKKKLAYLYYPSDKYLPTELKKSKLCESVYHVLRAEKVKYNKVNMYYCYRSVGPFPASPFAKINHRGYHASVDSSGKADYVSFDGFVNKGDRLSLVSSNSTYLSKVVKLEYLMDPFQPAKRVRDFEVKGDTLFYEKPFEGDNVGTLLIYTDTSNVKFVQEKLRIHTLLYNGNKS